MSPKPVRPITFTVFGRSQDGAAVFVHCGIHPGKSLTSGIEMCVRVRSLQSPNPATNPSGASLHVDHDPARWFTSDSFGDELSSIRFG